MKELRVQVRIKNNRLLERREKLGLTQHLMADVIGMPSGRYADLENLRTVPVVDNRWIPDVERIAEYFDVDPSDLFPDAVFNVRQPVVERSVDASDLLPPALSGYTERLLLPPDQVIDGAELASSIDAALTSLPPREEDVLRMKFGLDEDDPMTFVQIADQRLGCSRTRCAQIGEQALGKVRKRVLARDREPVPAALAGVRAEVREEVRADPRPEPADPMDSVRSMYDLVKLKPSAHRGVRFAWEWLIRKYPGRVRARVELSKTAWRKILITVLVSGSTAEWDSGADERTLRSELAWRGESHHVKIVSFGPIGGVPRPRGGRVTLADLEEDARLGGFAIAGRDRRVLRLRLSQDEDGRDQVLRMRFWFCDRADIASVEAEAVGWEVPREARETRRKQKNESRGGPF